MGIQVISHTSLLGHTGYAQHSLAFFTELNKYIPTRVRNFSHINDISYLTQKQKNMIIQQKWDIPPYEVGTPLILNPNDTVVNLVLNESHHYYFYDNYPSPKIAFNVWESTRQIPEFFNKLLEYDQFWCPTEWQKQCTIEQGYSADKIRVVPEAVDGNVYFCPKSSVEQEQIRQRLYKKYNIPEDAVTFLYFGRWDYRKAVTETIQAFNDEFKNDKNVYLILSADNPFPSDGMKTTEERLQKYKINNNRIKVLHFPEKKEYVEWLQAGHVFLSCARSEGWNLPLSEAIACGTPSICSNWSGQLEFANDIAHKVNISKFLPPKNVFMIGDRQDLGVWAEPDFDHLRHVMRDVLKNYKDNKINAVKHSNLFIEKYSWDNAAKLANNYIQELVKTIKPTTNQNKKFSLKYEKGQNFTKVFITSLYADYKTIRVQLINSDGQVCFETEFDEMKRNCEYWIMTYRELEYFSVKIYDNNICILSENKSFGELPTNKNVELYQDQYVNGEVVKKGRVNTTDRYESLKQVFSKYKRPFTILDIGSNFGYYSIRAVTEFDAYSTMIESEDETFNILKDLCEKNNCKNKLIILKTRMDLYKLKQLEQCEHFDVVLALNVIHHFKTDEVLEVCQTIEKLGDNLIFESPPIKDTGACGQNNLQIVENYFKSKNGKSLGKYKRHTSDTMTELFWFENSKKEIKYPYYGYKNIFLNNEYKEIMLDERKSNNIISNYNEKNIFSPRRNKSTNFIPGINLKTFVELNGQYPLIKNLISDLENKRIETNYKWDNSNSDLVIHNFILSGNELNLIDYDDSLIYDKNENDSSQLKKVVDEIKNIYQIEIENDNKIKLNLGCGNVIEPGYINIDKYNNTKQVDFQLDIGDLSVFNTESVDEIYNSHVFEHISINDMYSVLTEWRRVLKIGGKLVLRLPDLETEVKAWLDSSDDQKWLNVHRIFGAQTHPGNSHYCGFNCNSLKSFLESFYFEVKDIKLGNRGYGQEIQCTAIKLSEPKYNPPKIIVHFVDGPFIDIQGDQSDKGYYQIDFIDPDNDSTVHSITMKINTWTRPHRKYFTNWLVKVRRNGEYIYEHKFDLTGRNVLISFDTRSLGDTLAWVPYAEEFRKKHKCNVILSTFWNHLFKGNDSYKNISFIEPGSVAHNLYASYSVGCYDGNFNKNKIEWKTVPLQKVCSDTLGIEYKEIITDINFIPKSRPVKEKYVTISEHSTFKCKYWNYPNGWQTVVDYLNSIGYKVMVISKEPTQLQNIINMTNRPIDETMNNIYHSEFIATISTGPAWIAWALKKHVVMISGFSMEIAEFQTNITRIINKEVCHGCFNKQNNNFDRGDWAWCPFQKGTERQFECTKQITPEMVIERIKKKSDSVIFKI